jgi:hypothetical protein
MLSKKDVPEWLKNSRMYETKGYRDFPKEEIPICDLKLTCLNDFSKVMKAIRFWDLDSPYPREIWDYVFTERTNLLKQVLEKDDHIRQFITCQSVYLCYLAASEGEINLLKYTVELEGEDEGMYPMANECLLYAVQSRNLECVIYLHECGCQLSDYLIEEAVPFNEDCFFYLAKFLPLPENIVTLAVKYGKLKILKYLKEQEYFIDKDTMIIFARDRGHKDIVTYLKNI